MTTQLKKRPERTFSIKGNKYVLYKEGKNTFIELEGEIVFSNNVDKLSASQWLKAKKNNKKK